MKNLFNEDEFYNKEGCQFSNDIKPKLEEILKEGSAKGYSIRDMEYIIMRALPLITTTLHVKQHIAKIKQAE